MTDREDEEHVEAFDQALRQFANWTCHRFTQHMEAKSPHRAIAQGPKLSHVLTSMCHVLTSVSHVLTPPEPCAHFKILP